VGNQIVGFLVSDLTDSLLLIGILVPQNQDMNGGAVKHENLKLMQYKPPGPAVWTG